MEIVENTKVHYYKIRPKDEYHDETYGWVAEHPISISAVKQL